MTGAGEDMNFAAPVILFISNINEEAIVSLMKESKNLDIQECKKMSNPDARTSRFKVTIKAADNELAMDSNTWPNTVNVRPFRHFCSRREGGQGGQFGQ